MHISCCLCGVSTPPSSSNTCFSCSQLSKVPPKFPTNHIIHHCRRCERFLVPPSKWVYCELNSNELLVLLVKKLRVKILDSKFIPTERHSKVIKLMVTTECDKSTQNDFLPRELDFDKNAQTALPKTSDEHQFSNLMSDTKSTFYNNNIPVSSSDSLSVEHQEILVNDFFNKCSQTNMDLNFEPLMNSEKSLLPEITQRWKVLNQTMPFSSTSIPEKVKKYVDTLVTFKIQNQQCIECQRLESKQYWQSLVQVRQQAGHKRTLLFLEQILQKCEHISSCSKITERKNGIDFYFQNRVSAEQLCAFIKRRFVCTLKISNRLLSEDRRSNTKKYKFCYSINLPFISRDDLVYLSGELSKKLGCGLCLVLKIHSTIKLLDIENNCEKVLTEKMYTQYKNDIKVIASYKDLNELHVSDIFEKNGDYQDLYLTKDGINNYHAKSLIQNLEIGDTVLGYNLLNTINEDISQFKMYAIRKKQDKSRKIRVKTKIEDKNEVDMFVEDLLNDGEDLKGVDLYDENDNLIEDIASLQIN